MKTISKIETIVGIRKANLISVSKRHSCTCMWYSCTCRRNQNIPLVGGNPVTLEFDASSDDNKVKFLEHVEVLSNIHYHRRGCLEIDLESPSGKCFDNI